MPENNGKIGRRTALKTIGGFSASTLTVGTAVAGVSTQSGPYYYSSTDQNTSYNPLGGYEETAHVTTSLREEDPVMLKGHDHYTIVLRHDSISEAQKTSDGSLLRDVTVQTLQTTFPESSTHWIDSDKKSPYYGAKDYVPGDQYNFGSAVTDISEFLIGEASFVGTAYSGSQLASDLLSGVSERLDNTDEITRKWKYVQEGSGAKSRASPYVKYDAKLMPGESMYADFQAHTTTQYPDVSVGINSVYLNAPSTTSQQLEQMSTAELNEEGFERITPAQIRAGHKGTELDSTIRQKMVEENRTAYVARGWGIRQKKAESGARQPEKVGN